MTLSERLADFAAGLAFSSIPESAIAAAKDRILDGIGIALASSRCDFAQRTVKALSGLDRGAYPVIGFAQGLSLRDSAIANGVLIHGLDFDDTHLAGVVHPTASAFPCALAMTLHAGASGRDLLTGYVLALESSVRLGAVAKGELNQIGFHPTGVIATFGAALAAGKLMGLDREGLIMAQGIALSLAAGTREYSSDGSWTKRLHPGWAAASGINAAALAKHGFMAPRTAYEGTYGLYATHLGRETPIDIAAATAGLGSRWEVEHVAIKPLPACQLSIASIEAALALGRAHPFAPDEITRIEVTIPPHAVAIVCEPVKRRRRPDSTYAAQFSIQFGVACALIRKRFGLAELDLFADPDIRRLAERVSYAVDHSEQAARDFAGAVKVILKNGERLSRRQHAPSGSPVNPVTREQVGEKFFANAMQAISREKAEAIAAAVFSLDTAEGAGPLAALLANPDGG